ncbi:hypothetical protein, partial [Oleiphilus sp. HI0043]
MSIHRKIDLLPERSQMAWLILLIATIGLWVSLAISKPSLAQSTSSQYETIKVSKIVDEVNALPYLDYYLDSSFSA